MCLDCGYQRCFRNNVERTQTGESIGQKGNVPKIPEKTKRGDLIVKECYKRVYFGNFVSVYELCEEEIEKYRQYPNGITIEPDVIRAKYTEDDGTVRVTEQTANGVNFIRA